MTIIDWIVIALIGLVFWLAYLGTLALADLCAFHCAPGGFRSERGLMAVVGLICITAATLLGYLLAVSP